MYEISFIKVKRSGNKMKKNMKIPKIHTTSLKLLNFKVSGRIFSQERFKQTLLISTKYRFIMENSYLDNQ